MTPAELILEIEQAFRSARLAYGHGTGNARDEAAWLVEAVLRARSGAPATRTARALAARRIRTRQPLAYLLHEAWIGEHRFYVDRRVIVPRSFIGELIGDGLAPWIARAPRRALDLCTGSGCLGILLAHRYPRCRVDLTDISAAALQVARRNVALHRVRSRTRVTRSDLYAALGDTKYDLIVANPPYVRASSMKTLPAEYLREPRLSLAGGADGLDLARRIISGAGARLTKRGVLVCEIGHNRKALERAFPRTPFTWLETSAGDSYVFVLEREQLPLDA
ncbi:MAG: 50S ribosomal protein L3 N(5)-glutamine methyltransferase [Burkholderiales bacterium]